jgi:hypothetical protein
LFSFYSYFFSFICYLSVLCSLGFMFMFSPSAVPVEACAWLNSSIGHNGRQSLFGLFFGRFFQWLGAVHPCPAVWFTMRVTTRQHFLTISPRGSALVVSGSSVENGEDGEDGEGRAEGEDRRWQIEDAAFARAPVAASAGWKPQETPRRGTRPAWSSPISNTPNY